MPPLSPIFVLLGVFFALGAAAYPGPPIPPMEVAKDFYERFMKAVNSGDKNEIMKFYSPYYLRNSDGIYQFLDFTREIAGYSYTIEMALHDIFEQPGKNTDIMNTTVFFRGPHPTYTRKNFDIILENQFQNPQAFPDKWQIKTMTQRIYAPTRKNFKQSSQENIIAMVLQEFMNAVNSRDIPRLERVIQFNEAVSPTGMQQLYNLLAGNQGYTRSYRIVNASQISATVVFTNPYTKVANLFWFVFKNENQEQMWKIVDMKLMFGDFGPPKDFTGNGFH